MAHSALKSWYLPVNAAEWSDPATTHTAVEFSRPGKEIRLFWAIFRLEHIAWRVDSRGQHYLGTGKTTQCRQMWATVLAGWLAGWRQWRQGVWTSQWIEDKVAQSPYHTGKVQNMNAGKLAESCSDEWEPNKCKFRFPRDTDAQTWENSCEMYVFLSSTCEEGWRQKNSNVQLLLCAGLKHKPGLGKAYSRVLWTRFWPASPVIYLPELHRFHHYGRIPVHSVRNWDSLW